MGRVTHYPESLLKALSLNEICGLKPGLDYSKMTKDQMKGLEFLIENLLTEREQMVLKGRFVACMSMKKLSEKYGLRENRIRGIFMRAVLKMHDRELLFYVADGYELRTKYVREHLQWQEQSYRYQIEATDSSHLYFQDIESLGLPVRVTHALQRRGICKVRDLVILSQYIDGVHKIRSLGEVSEDQIEEALYKGGLVPEHYEKIRDKTFPIQMVRELAAFQNLNISYLREKEHTGAEARKINCEENNRESGGNSDSGDACDGSKENETADDGREENDGSGSDSDSA